MSAGLDMDYSKTGVLQGTFDSLRSRGKKALITYVTAGDPDIGTTLLFMKEMAAGGADIVELGVPYSDPLADGKTIQRAAVRALKKGTNTDHILDVVSKYRFDRDIPQIPVVLLLYYNSILAYGPEKFVDKAAASGVNGLVVPDLPPEEAEPLRGLCRLHDVDLICLLAPTSNDERVKLVSQVAEGFIYCVSVNGVTGAREGVAGHLKDTLERFRRFTDVPLAVGFGISSPQDAAAVARMADGVIVGSAIVQRIEKALASGSDTAEASSAVREYIGELRTAIDNCEPEAAS